MTDRLSGFIVSLEHPKRDEDPRRTLAEGGCMTRQDIEVAIAYFNEPSTDCHTSETLQKAVRTLIHVAEAWRGLDEWMVKMNYHDGTIGKKMKELLNPPKKTDLERVREWADKHEVSTLGRWSRYEDRGELRALLDRLEAEKEKP